MKYSCGIPGPVEPSVVDASAPTPKKRQGPHRSEYGYIAGPWVCKMQFGGWYVRQDPENWDGMGYQHVCSLSASRKGTYYGELFSATARLIAAAPDLLEAVLRARRHAMNIGIESGSYVETLDAAIAKAIGDGHG